MLTRTEFKEGSMSTFSFSLRLITSGFNNASFDLLQGQVQYKEWALACLILGQNLP